MWAGARGVGVVVNRECFSLFVIWYVWKASNDPWTKSNVCFILLLLLLFFEFEIWYEFNLLLTSLVAQTVKHLSTMRETWVRSLGWKVPWRRKRQPTPVLLPRKSHGWRSLVSMVIASTFSSSFLRITYSFTVSFLYVQKGILMLIINANYYINKKAILFPLHGTS